MPEITVIVSGEELKALEWDIYEVQDWIQNAISEKARRVMDRLIEQNTNLNYKKLSKGDKEAEINKMVLKTAKERQQEFEQEMKDEDKGR